MYSHPVKGAFQPEELRSLQSIYDEIISRTWFPKCLEARRQFAKYLFRNIPGDGLGICGHLAEVEAAARKFYALDRVD